MNLTADHSLDNGEKEAVRLIPDGLIGSDEGLGIFQIEEDTEDLVLGIVDVVARGHCRARIDITQTKYDLCYF